MTLIFAAPHLHECDPPSDSRGMPAYNWGSVWQCDCGRFWVSEGPYWYPVSKRRAARIVKDGGLR